MNQSFLLLLVVLIGFCLVAFFILVDALFKGMVDGISQHAGDAPGKSFWVGLVNTIFLVAITIGLMALAEISGIGPVFAVPGLAVSIFIVVGIVFGLTAMVRLVAGLIFPDKKGWKAIAPGAGILILACLVPYIGWFGLYPYLGLRGFGAFILYLMDLYRARRLRREEAASA